MGIPDSRGLIPTVIILVLDTGMPKQVYVEYLRP